MTLALKQLKVYLKLAAVLTILIVVLLLVIMNRKNTADIWFFRSYEQVNVLWLILVTAVTSVIIWWVFRKVFGVMRELKEVRQSRKAQAQMQEQRKLADELSEREKRLDEKLRQSIGDQE